MLTSIIERNQKIGHFLNIEKVALRDLRLCDCREIYLNPNALTIGRMSCSLQHCAEFESKQFERIGLITGDADYCKA